MDATPAGAAPAKGLARRLYDWILGFADSRHALTALALLAFAESSFFPIPPDVLLLALCLGAPRRSFRYATICSIFSVLGGIGGYYIGFAAEPLGRSIITTLAGADAFETVALQYGDNAFLAIVSAAFTPIPYKVFTIAAGMFHDFVPLQTLIVASVVGRSARFFLEAGLIWKFGRPIQGFIDRYFNLLTIGALLLLVGGFAALKLAKSDHIDAAAIESSLDNDNGKVRSIRLQSVEKKAGRSFGFDTRFKGSAPENAAALDALRAWMAERSAAGG